MKFFVSVDGGDIDTVVVDVGFLLCLRFLLVK